jgi:hypothetical protein
MTPERTFMVEITVCPFSLVRDNNSPWIVRPVWPGTALPRQPDHTHNARSGWERGLMARPHLKALSGAFA